MKEYALAMGANEEVLMWCDTVLAAKSQKSGINQTEAEHIIDYLVSDAAPSRLRKMSYEQAKSNAEKWTKANQKKGRDIVDGDEDLELIHDFLDGTRIVKLLTKKSYQREGFLMRHCLGAYDPDNTIIYSYRDANNDPHATFEVSTSNGEIFQIKGKGNGSIHPKYINPILTFLMSIGKQVRPSDMKNLGYYHVKEDAQKIMDMFVDKQGNGPKYTTIMNNKYIYA